MFFFENLEIFQNRYVWQIFSTMRLRWHVFLKMSFHLILEVFLAKITKKIKGGKVGKYDEKTVF